MASCATVIFDLDGVLADTIPYFYKAYLEIVAKHGSEGSAPEFDELNGKSLDEICDRLISGHRLNCLVGELREEFRSAFESIYDDVGLVEGVGDLLDELSASEVAIGLATSAPRQMAVGFLEKHGIAPYFAEVIGGDDIERAKPDPEIFLRAKAALPCSPHYVLEDSLNGLNAAVSAGATAVHFRQDCHFRTPAGLRSIDSLAEFSGVLFADDAEMVAASGDIRLVEAEEERGELPEGEAERVERCWEQQLETRPSMYDGEIVQYHSHQLDGDGKLTIRFQLNRYRRLLTQLTIPLDLKIQPLAVSGVLVDQAGKVLVGRRSREVTEYPGAYELVPSGGVTPDHSQESGFLEQWKSELREECGIDPDQIEDIAMLGLCRDSVHGVYDIALSCVMKREFLPEDFRGNGEYSLLLPVSAEALPEFLASHVVTPTARLIARLHLERSAN